MNDQTPYNLTRPLWCLVNTQRMAKFCNSSDRRVSGGRILRRTMHADNSLTHPLLLHALKAKT